MQRHHGLTASAVALIVAASIVVSCSDASGPDSASLDPTLFSGELQGGGWTPSVEAAGKKAGKIDVCHSGNGKKYVHISVSANATRAHLGDPETGMGGHSADYRTSELTPCPPPDEPGLVQVCKVAGSGVATGANFSYTVTANGEETTVTVPAGAGPGGTCVDAGSFRVGTDVTVQEVAQPNVNVTGLTVSPEGAQVGVSDLANRTAMVVAGVGTTKVTYTNTSTTAGSLVICKVGGTGVAAGTNFTFTVEGQSVTVPAGAAPTGNCGAALVLPAGTPTVTETAVAGTSVQSITGTPAAPTNINLGARSATVQITSGQETRITFTNTAP